MVDGLAYEMEDSVKDLVVYSAMKSVVDVVVDVVVVLWQFG